MVIFILVFFSLSSRQCHFDTQAQFWRWVYQRLIFDFQALELPQFRQLLWSKCRIIDHNSHQQAQQPLEMTTSRSLHVLPLPPLKGSGSAELLQVRSP